MLFSKYLWDVVTSLGNYSKIMKGCRGSANTNDNILTSGSDSNDEGNQEGWLYRQTDDGRGLATIFNADDPNSFYNWRLAVGNNQNPRPPNSTFPTPRFREIIDAEIEFPAFELTGDHDGSVFMMCPPYSEYNLSERLPYLNFIMTDLGGYASIELVVTNEFGNTLQIVAKNFISRTCISQKRMEIPMRLRPSWNYACFDLNQLLRDAWNTKYRNLRLIKVNANVRVRRIYFSDRMYSYEDLPNEFKINLKQSPTTQLEIIDYENAFPPSGTNNTSSTLKFSPLWEPNKLALGFNSVKNITISPLIEKDSTENQQDIELGLKLSVPSNYDVLNVMISESVKYKPDSMPSILWKYPQRESKPYRGTGLMDPNYKDNGATGITFEGYNRVLNPPTVNNGSPNNSNLLDPVVFCDYIWKAEENGEAGEWEMIENAKLQPQKISEIHKHRRGEGYYDIYKAKMVPKDEQDFFGFGDNEEEAKLIMKRQSLQAKNKAASLGDVGDIETYRNPNATGRPSSIDKTGDWDFLKHAESGMNPQKTGGISNEEAGVPDHRSVGTDPSSTGGDEDWLLTWTYEGLDWKETRMKNQAKLKEEIRSFLCKDKRSCQKPEKDIKKTEASIPGWRQMAVPIEPMQCGPGYRGTGMCYHVCFDSKTLPFQK